MYYEQYLYYRISAVAIGNGVISDRTHQIQKGEVTLCLARIIMIALVLKDCPRHGHCCACVAHHRAAISKPKGAFLLPLHRLSAGSFSVLQVSFQHRLLGRILSGIAPRGDICHFFAPVSVLLIKKMHFFEKKVAF